jgi:hypothetical protein
VNPVHCRVQLADGRAALPRVVALLHGKGLAVEHLHIEGSTGCLLVSGAAASRALAVLERLVDVVSVELTRTCREQPAPVLPTRYVIWREELPAAG